MKTTNNYGTLERIIDEIVEHDRLNPSHGVGCACHDTHAGTIRCLLEAKGLTYGNGRKSLQNLITVLGYVTNNP